MKKIKIKNLTKQEFAPYGDVIEADEKTDYMLINNGKTKRFHDLARVSALGTNARIAISIFRSKPFSLPYRLDFMERHPYGSQAFMPMSLARFLVIVADDENGKAGEPKAFLAKEGQGVNYYPNIWHGALVALDKETDFLVVDREGVEKNLELYDFEDAYWIEE